MANEEHEVLKMERAALNRWGQGDPSGFLEICAEDVVYFDPFHNRRVDGLAALTREYEACRGKVRVDCYTLINPRVQLCGEEVAVLTFNHEGISGGAKQFWNCTEVYRKDLQGWRIIQTHWSLNKA